MRFTFKTYERLKREQDIDTLFRTGKAFSVLQLRFLYRVLPRQAGEASSVKAGFSVPKKRFRKSVSRHRVRRLMVEAWRLNKERLYSHLPPEKQLHLFIIYTTNEVVDFAALQDTMNLGIDRLIKDTADA